tara:strand:- start:3378 stop:3668 length:291 start_codon:yes stop_codon:yes gene_type:complete
MNKIIEILAVYAILHITYTDLGFDIGKKHKALVVNKYTGFILILATVMHNYEYGQDGNMEYMLITLSLFYGLLLWGKGQLSLPFLDKIVDHVEKNQ